MGSFSLNPGNPLGSKRFVCTTINTVDNFRDFKVFVGDQLNFNTLYQFCHTYKQDCSDMNLTLEIINSLAAGETTYLANYNSRYYELAGNIGGGIVVGYKGSNTVSIYFIGEENGARTYQWHDVYATYVQGDYTKDFKPYLLDSHLFNGSEDPLTEGTCLYGPPFTEETAVLTYEFPFVDYVYNYTKTDIDFSLQYSGSDLYIVHIPGSQEISYRRSPNIANHSELVLGKWWFNWAAANIEYEEDPQNDSDYNDPGGGDGQPQDSVDIDFPELPPNVLLQSGIIKMFNPSVQNMNDFVNFIYSSPDNIIANFKKIWANPMESIVSLGLIPFTVPSTGGEEIRFCGVDSTVVAPVITNQYMTVDCGHLQLNEEYKTILDYANYTKIKLYLPFIGIKEINTDDVMNAYLELKYNIDLLTGDCVAMLKSSKTEKNVKYASVLYSYNGNVITQVPLSGNNYQQLYSSIIGLVSNTIAPTPTGVAGVGSDILGQKVTVQRSGNLTGNCGALAEYVPYLIIEKPLRSVPEHNNKLIGYPCNMFGKLDPSYQNMTADGKYSYTFKGYTEVEKGTFRTTGFSKKILDEEARELVEILEGGFIL